MDRKRLLRNPLLWLLAVLLLFYAFSVLFDDTRGYQDVSTSTALQQISQGNVAEATIEDKEQRLRLTLNDGVQVQGSNRIITKYPTGANEDIVNRIEQSGVSNWNTEVSQSSIWSQLLLYLIPVGLLVLLVMWMMNNAQGGGSKVLNFGKSKAKQFTKDMPKTLFGDVAGADEAVEELHEIKDFLQYPTRYQALGAKIPKGVLLDGPPGTGKTLLARAVAGEAGVPFYSISGSDFVEMFVGVGASRVRDLFEQAKQNAPCIVFVDEIDAVGRQRGAGVGGGHDEREQTLNQLLVEMDGFDSRGGIILIAATNRSDILDPALLRPGRFDRQIPVAAPDLRGRRAILNVHSKGKPLAPDVDLDGLAKRTVGFSGADLENVVNEAALLTARENAQLITGAALEESVDRVIGGPRRKNKVISERDKKITAYHEGGHALAAWAMPDLEPVYKLTILPRGKTGGHALVVPEDDKDMMTRSEMIGRLVFALGGRSSEELIFHEPTTGASSDIEQATKIARAMVTEYGMTARLGAVKYGKEEGDPFLGRSAGQQPNYSLEVAHEIDEEVRKLIEAAHTEAWEILSTYRDVLDNLVREVLEKETLNRADLERIFAEVEKRPRITAFNDFGGRTPSDKPPIKTPGELAMERGEPWPPPVNDQPSPAPVGAVPGANGYGAQQPGQQYGSEQQQGHPPQGYPAQQPPQQPPQGNQPPGTAQMPYPGGAGQPQQPPQGYPPQGGQPPQGVPPNYGAPPGWTPATSPGGQPYQPPAPNQHNWVPSWEGGARPENGQSVQQEGPRTEQIRQGQPEQPSGESGGSTSGEQTGKPNTEAEQDTSEGSQDSGRSSGGDSGTTGENGNGTENR
ncbi:MULTISPECIES: ATP-dependent zinc metalloprotease FtsH [Actinopolyspora]|uniref:ATP-dependent zinc metalloprotease FtsH n=1 Tax=Actinopolyspora saharensis TaxID=995062 RepID=A0A1H1F5K7_9ACTN|nr:MULTISPECIES: ATP-dependent zinc metalloprotease FtsH [Actinopolyspora]NHD19149.1 ATP-dependent metallopeptidase FtsH/Yme1/Tma family protein [Actinopolyspora sp. BKK2]NHE78273.1 ATP-dependent metallopeptidase FtsH/Yme1/Tma family protein [Actinopolyspora sp. BKK1]SDQ96198.1 membrane protease FtsH catalytic subunit [Actinopolyspora saharensis]